MSDQYHYLRLAIGTRCTDPVRIRKSLQDALTDLFGHTAAGTYMDVLFVDEAGSETVVRVHAEDEPRVLAAVVRASIRCAVVKRSSFLPSLVC